MTKDANSTEEVPLNDQLSPDESLNPKPPSKLVQQTWRWREMITAAFVIVDYFLLYSSISLMGVFFPIEVCIAILCMHYNCIGKHKCRLVRKEPQCS